MNEDTQAGIRAFVKERDWEQFHTPRNLVLALTGEVGELAELMQWKSDSEFTVFLEIPQRRALVEAKLS